MSHSPRLERPAQRRSRPGGRLVAGPVPACGGHEAQLRSEFAIGKRWIGDGYPCLVVGEVAQAHEGSLGMAHAFIDAIADADADAVKFQTHLAAAESTADEPFRIALSPQDTSRHAYWRRMEFTREQWLGLVRHAEERGLIFLSSPFSTDAVELLAACGIKAWKLASGEICHWALIDLVARTRQPVLLSTGMCTWQEIKRAVDRVTLHQAPLAVLQCTSKYPTPPEDIGVQLIPRLRRLFRCVAGLSDHSGTIYPGIVSPAFGARIVEVHVALSRQMYGPDVAASITTQELQDLVRGIRVVERMMAAVPDKDALARDLTHMRASFFRSIVARRPIPAGSTLHPEHVALKKPGTGLPPDALRDIVGLTAIRDIPVNCLLRLEDFAPRAAVQPAWSTTHDSSLDAGAPKIPPTGEGEF